MKSAPLSRTPTQSSMEIGQRFESKEQTYELLELISPPKQCYWYGVVSTGDFGQVQSDYFAFEEDYWVENVNSGQIGLCVVRYEYMSKGISMERMVAHFNEYEGDAKEPRGYHVFVLKSLGTITGRSDRHRCYIWQAENSLDYVGGVHKKEQLRSRYVIEHTPPGTILTLASDERYLVESFIASDGAFGTVLKAKRLSDGYKVALKIQATDAAKQEVNVLQALAHHPLIVDLFDAGLIVSYQGTEANLDNPFREIVSIVEKGQVQEQVRFACLVVEFVEGKTIETIVGQQGSRALSDKRGLSPAEGVPIRQAINIIEQLCNAIDYIHNRGFLHADIKPQNVMVDKDGLLRIVDMGSVSPKGQGLYAMGIGPHAAPEIKEYYLNRSKALRLRDLASSTEFNTTAIMQPLSTILDGAHTCQLASEHAYQSISERTDVFSVGATFFSLLVGRHPRQMSGESIQDPRKPDSITLNPIRVERVLIDRRYFSGDRRYFKDTVKKALNVDPQKRYPNGQALKHDLRYGLSRLVRDDFFLSALITLGALFFLIPILTLVSYKEILGPTLVVLTLLGAWVYLERSTLGDVGIRRYEYLTTATWIARRAIIVCLFLVFLSAYALNTHQQKRLDRANALLEQAIAVHEQVKESPTEVDGADIAIDRYEEVIAEYDWIINMVGYPYEDIGIARQARRNISIPSWNVYQLYMERSDLANAFEKLKLSHLTSPSDNTRHALFELGYRASLNNDRPFARECFGLYLASIPVISSTLVERFDGELVQKLVEIVESDPRDQKAEDLVFIVTYIEPYRLSVVYDDQAQLRALPNSQSELVGVLASGTQIAILTEAQSDNDGDFGQWYHVWANGHVGYILIDTSN